MSNSIVLVNDGTEFTRKYERVFVEDGCAWQQKLRTKYFQNRDQLDHVIHDLVVNKGYIMDTVNKDVVLFKHPTLKSSYTIYHNELAGSYEDTFLLGKLK